MRLLKPKFWDKKHYSFFSVLFYPLTYFLDLHEFITATFIKKKKISNIKTICVGNIYIGGTGKTPLTEFLANYLNKKIKTVIIKKKYNQHLDEKKFLEKKNKVMFYKSRINALRIAVKNKFKVAVFDDGLQDKYIDFDLKIVCFSSYTLIGNKLRLPAGPLREKISNLKNYQGVVINGRNNFYKKKFINEVRKINPKLKIFNSEYKPINLKSLIKNKYLVFSGIGNPQSFINTLRDYKINNSMNFIFPDHYQFRDVDIERIKHKAKIEKLKILTTEKDFSRLKAKQRKDIDFLKINLKIKEKKKFIEFLHNYI
tara:strand:- start:9409 stop:10347 length:939 start_codon:yes stop_codon:yes gene_type:complete